VTEPNEAPVQQKIEFDVVITEEGLVISAFVPASYVSVVQTDEENENDTGV
jgi:hypothetical protein